MSAKLVVLISGNGSNLQAILDACVKNELPASVVTVILNKAEAYGLTRAQNADVPAIHFPKLLDESRRDYNTRLASESLEQFEARVHTVEHKLMVATIKSQIENRKSKL